MLTKCYIHYYLNKLLIEIKCKTRPLAKKNNKEKFRTGNNIAKISKWKKIYITPDNTIQTMSVKFTVSKEIKVIFNLNYFDN